MIQFYFLSIFLNLFGGYALAVDAAKPRGTAFDGFRTSLRDPTVRLVLGILSAVTGAFKLLTVIRGDIPIVGDFLPALTGLAVGCTLLLELYRSPDAPFRRPAEAQPGPVEKDEPEAASEPSAPRASLLRLEGFFLENRASVGIAGMIAGLVHFLFPMVLFL